MTSENSILPAQKLKAATATAHQQIEDAFPVMRDDFDLQQYKTLLCKLYGFHLPLDAAISGQPQVSNWIHDYSDRKKIRLLEADLEYFQVSKSDLQSLAYKELWFEPSSKALILGTLYVLEGSTLGGQLISKHLKNKFQFPDLQGTHFFSAYGSQTGVMWKRFQAMLNNHLAEDILLEQGVQAANATFEHLGRWLKHHH